MMTMQTRHFLVTAYPRGESVGAMVSFVDGSGALTVDSAALEDMAAQLKAAGLCIDAVRKIMNEERREG